MLILKQIVESKSRKVWMILNQQIFSDVNINFDRWIIDNL